MGLFGKRKQKIYFKEKELEQLNVLPWFTKGSIELDGKPFLFHEPRSFYVSHKEIFKEEIYLFKTDNAAPYIIDCGANMGVSVLFFAKKYPNARIIAFEPEEAIGEVLEKNILSFDLKNVTLHKKAVWDKETVLEFTSDHGMGGSVTNTFSTETPVKVPTLRLADFLQQPVDFLKLDIEGAEYVVLKDCQPYLKNVKNLFVEYHSFINQEQKLEEILLMLKENGFRYHLRQSFSQERPFVDEVLACENMDMAINIFAYRK